jgi:hypothetical protein
MGTGVAVLNSVGVSVAMRLRVGVMVSIGVAMTKGRLVSR